MMSPGSKRRPRPGGGADDISCLCSFLDVPCDKAIRGARDGSPWARKRKAPPKRGKYILEGKSKIKRTTPKANQGHVMRLPAAVSERPMCGTRAGSAAASRR